jgi:hypothetical protein
MMVNIDWEYPQPRPGFAGQVDKFMGPGTNRAEWLTIGFFTFLGGVVLPLVAYARGVDWSIGQYLVAGFLALDLSGGIVTNATAAAKRWYHRRGQSFRQHFSFTAVHVVHIALVAWLFRDLDWVFFLVMAATLLGAAVIILRAPLYLRRPLAFGLFAFSILIGVYAVAPTVGLEWFIPFLFLKLLVSHLLREEPYRPAAKVPRGSE